MKKKHEQLHHSAANHCQRGFTGRDDHLKYFKQQWYFFLRSYYFNNCYFLNSSFHYLDAAAKGLASIGMEERSPSKGGKKKMWASNIINFLIITLRGFGLHNRNRQYRDENFFSSNLHKLGEKKTSSFFAAAFFLYMYVLSLSKIIVCHSTFLHYLESLCVFFFFIRRLFYVFFLFAFLFVFFYALFGNLKVF